MPRPGWLTGGEKTHVESSAHAVWERERRESSQTRRSEPAASSDACRPAPDPAQVLPEFRRGRAWPAGLRTELSTALEEGGEEFVVLQRRRVLRRCPVTAQPPGGCLGQPCCAPTLLAVTVGIVDQERKRPPTRVHHRSGDQWWRRQVSEACLQGAVDRVPECEVIARDGVPSTHHQRTPRPGQHQPHLPVADPAAGPSHPCQQTLVGLDGARPHQRQVERRDEGPKRPLPQLIVSHRQSLEVRCPHRRDANAGPS